MARVHAIGTTMQLVTMLVMTVIAVYLITPTRAVDPGSKTINRSINLDLTSLT